jgi:uncharacterized protein with von Willebrand factor type A (vWA) domain
MRRRAEIDMRRAVTDSVIEGGELVSPEGFEPSTN